MSEFSKGIPTRKDASGPAVYGIRHVETGKLYYGSASNCYNRITNHKSALRQGIHKNAELQEAYNQNPELEFMHEPTRDIEEARAREQSLIDAHHGTGRIFNVATDVNAPQRGLVRSDETKKRLSDIKTGVARDEDVARRIRETNQQNNGRKVSVNGTIYPSVRDAARQLGMVQGTVQHRLKSGSSQFEDWTYVEA